MSYEQMTIAAYAEGLGIGERKGRLLCPFCHGGGSKELSLSMVMYSNGLQWKCWRASCGKKGRIGMSGAFFVGAPTEGLDSVQASSEIMAGTNWQPLYNLTEISDQWKDVLQTRFGIKPELAIGKGWQGNKYGHLVIPMKACTRQVVGHEFRQVTGEPKSRMNLLVSKEFPRNAFETKENKDVVMIVEDGISALKGSQVCRTYSLQGTNLTQKHVEELSMDWNANLILLALDKDATEKAAGYLQRYSFLLPNMRLCPLEKDLKYYYVSEIQQLVESYA